ncbi:MAG: type II toxin-antitoxin system PemK/MazF family toxin [Candidatus Eremiobacterota bacterium]
MNRGDIVLITFPFSDLSSTKVRPVLVISPEDRGQQDFIVALITSNIIRPLLDTDFLLLTSESEFPGTGLKIDSVFRMSKLHNLSKSLAKKRLGEISDGLMEKLEEKLLLALGLS